MELSQEKIKIVFNFFATPTESQMFYCTRNFLSKILNILSCRNAKCTHLEPHQIRIIYSPADMADTFDVNSKFLNKLQHIFHTLYSRETRLLVFRTSQHLRSSPCSGADNVSPFRIRVSKAIKRRKILFPN